MNRWLVPACLLILVACGVGSTRLAYPGAPRGEVVETYYGVDVADPYRWLEDLEDPAVKSYAASQHALACQTIASWGDRETVRAGLEAHWRRPTRGLPMFRDGTWFTRENDGQRDHAVYCRYRDPSGAGEVLLDPVTFSEDGRTTLTTTSVDPTGRWLVYGTSSEGNDWFKLHVYDLKTKQATGETLIDCKFTRPHWLQDGSGFYYNRYPRDEAFATRLGGAVAYLHRIGTRQSEDTEVARQPAKTNVMMSVSPTRDDHWLIHRYGRGGKNRLEISPRRSPDKVVSLVGSDMSASWSYVTNDGTTFYLQTNAEAPRKRLVRLQVDPVSGHPGAISTVLPQGRGVMRSVRPLGDDFLVQWFEDGEDHLVVVSRTGRRLREIALPEGGTLGAVLINRHEGGFWFRHESPIRPPTNYRVTGPDWTPRPVWTEPSSLKTPDYTLQKVKVKSRDGTLVPMTLAYRADLPRDGSAPALMVGYGGFNVSYKAKWSPWSAYWLERGGVIAYTNLRGGGEFGETWHRAGTGVNKQNVFDDFMACGQWLVDNRITSRKRLAIWGRSNGGLLTAACLLQKPQLFGAVLCGVPVIDMLRYHRFTIGRAWVGDYGNADEDAAVFRAQLKYSPAHNVSAGADYPPTLVYTSWSDDRVVPSHALKFIAALQWANPDGHPHLLRIEPDSGHGGAGSIDHKLEEYADMFAFLERYLRD